MRQRYLTRIDSQSASVRWQDRKRADHNREFDRPTDEHRSRQNHNDPTYARICVDDDELRRRANRRTRIIATMVAEGTLGTPNLIVG